MQHQENLQIEVQNVNRPPKLKKIIPELNNLEDDVIEQIEIEAKYAGYLDRQRMDIKDFFALGILNVF